MQHSTWFPKIPTTAKGDPDTSAQNRQWLLFDLDGVVLGRAATRIAGLLRGRHKATYTPHIDMGDFVVVINAEKVKLTGDKLQKKMYYRHTGFRGGIKETVAAELLDRKPEEVIRKAVKGMLPKNKMQDHLLKKLKVYAGTEHPHTAQNPSTVDLNDKKVASKPKQKEAMAAAPKGETKTEKKADAKTAKEETKK
jgi:large subunit ribosomal protein L13